MTWIQLSRGDEVSISQKRGQEFSVPQALSPRQLQRQQQSSESAQRAGLNANAFGYYFMEACPALSQSPCAKSERRVRYIRNMRAIYSENIIYLITFVLPCSQVR